MSAERRGSSASTYKVAPPARKPVSYGFAVGGLALTQNITPDLGTPDEQARFSSVVVPAHRVGEQKTKTWSPVPHYVRGG
jgi:hypothetical protein